MIYSEIARPTSPQDLSEELRASCGIVIRETLARLVEPVKLALPPNVFVNAYSSEYGCESKEDWCLNIILYNTRNHRLVQLTTKFAFLNGEHWFAYPRPIHLKANFLDTGSWFDLQESLTEIIPSTVRRAKLGQLIEVPTHAVTGHPLVPTDLIFG